MSDALPSLLAQDRQGALFLLPPSIEHRLEERGEYTAERLFSREPDKYRTIVAMIAAGRGIRSIKRECSVHHDTIHAVAAREKMSIDTLKQRIVSDIEAAIQVGAERAVEVMETIKPEQLMVGIGILIDKYQLLTGGATVRVETAESASPRLPATFDEWLATVKSAKTGLGVGEETAKGGESAPNVAIGADGSVAGAPGVVHRLPATMCVTDVESVVLQKVSGEDTNQDTDRAADEPVIARGEGGGEDPGGGLRRPTHPDSGNFAPKGVSPAATPHPSS